MLTCVTPEHFDMANSVTDVASDTSDLYQPSSGSETDDSDISIDESTDGDDKESVFLVYQSCLDKLFDGCNICNSLIQVDKLYRGTMVIYSWTCLNNHHGRWESQPVIRNMPVGNLQLSGATLFCGGTYKRIHDIAEAMNIHIFSERHFYNIQKSYLFPAIDSLYNKQHELLIDALRFEKVFLCGDGRSDSPGHCAKYLSYSFMEEDSDLILHFQLVQVTEAPGQASTNMERLAFNRGMTYLEEEDLVIEGIAPDRHPQIAADMNKLYPDMSHQFDIYHVAKSLEKKLAAKAKATNCEDLGLWHGSIILHFWWCCSSCSGDYEVLKDKWLSLLHHVCNVHEWASGEKINKCCHDPLSDSSVSEIMWLKPDSPSHKALQYVVFNEKLLKDMKKMVQFKHTGSLEIFHGMLLKYCPKREHFSYEGMRARLQLAVLDHNENVGREQAKHLDGSLCYSLVYPKRKKNWVVKKIYQNKTFNFRVELMKMLQARREDATVILGDTYMDRPALPRNIARSVKPDINDAVSAFISRFELLKESES